MASTLSLPSHSSPSLEEENCNPNSHPPQDWNLCSTNKTCCEEVKTAAAAATDDYDNEEDALSLHSEDHGDGNNNNYNAGREIVRHFVESFGSFSSLSDSSEGNITRTNYDGNGSCDISNESNNGGKRARRRWVFPSLHRPFSEQRDCSSCGSNESPKSGEWSISCAGGGEKTRKKLAKITCVQPFNLRTEQRGQVKEEEFMKKLQEMLAQETKLRIPIAQGLPWTTDEPQILPKPQVREQTKPLDIKLHTQARAIERAQFDQLIAEKFYFQEQRKLEEEKIHKLLEMEEVKRLRKGLIPRAQLMPFFDRPFIPKRSTRPLTVPKEPKFNIPRRKRDTYMSWNDHLYASCQS